MPVDSLSGSHLPSCEGAHGINSATCGSDG